MLFIDTKVHYYVINCIFQLAKFIEWSVEPYLLCAWEKLMKIYRNISQHLTQPLQYLEFLIIWDLKKLPAVYIDPSMLGQIGIFQNRNLVAIWYNLSCMHMFMDTLDCCISWWCNFAVQMKTLTRHFRVITSCDSRIDECGEWLNVWLCSIFTQVIKNNP